MPARGCVIVLAALALGACTQTGIGSSDRPIAGDRVSPLYAISGAPPEARTAFANGSVTDRAGRVDGGLIGEEIGGTLSANARTEALAAEYRALEYSRAGRPVVWRDPQSGVYGEVVAGAGYEVNDLDCRNYTHSVYVGGRRKFAQGTACRRIDRTWRIVG